MAKKVRRVRRRRTQPRPNDKPLDQGSTNPEPKTRQDAVERFQQEYAYVLKDLRQILILAAAMFALLILLNVLLRVV
jgi:hypothetical protein